MADVKISALPAATAATASEVPVNQAGTTKKVAMTAAGAAIIEAATAAAQRTAMGLSYAVADVNDANYTITTPDRMVGVRGLTAGRTQTLPAATGSGRRHLIFDVDGGCLPMFRIIVAPNGTDTINGRNASVKMWAPWSSWEFIDAASGTWLAMPSMFGMATLNPIGRGDVFVMENDLLGTGGGTDALFSVSAANGSVSASQPGGSADSKAKGAWGLIPGTSAGHYGTIRAPGANNSFVFRQWSRVVIEWLSSIRTTHDATNDSLTTWGICESLTTSDVANAAVFQIDRATNATNILGVCASSSTRTKTSLATGHAADVGGWHRYCLDLTPGTDCKFYIDDVLKATVSTNVPGSTSTSSSSIVSQARWVAGAMASAAISHDRIRAVYLPNNTYARAD